MNINSVIWEVFSTIGSVNNRGCQFKGGLNKIVLGCYNTIVSFIKPIFNENINYIGLRKSISNIENKINLDEDKKAYLNELKNTNEIENNKNINSDYKKARRTVKSDEVKECIINDIIDNLTNKVDQEKLNEFKKELFFHSKWILFSGNVGSLEKSKKYFLNSIADTILNSDDKIKPHFGVIDTYEFFLSQEINHVVDDVFYEK